MKQVYLLPVFLGAAFSMGVVHSPGPTEKKEAPSSFVVSELSVAQQDTIVPKQDTAKVAYVREDNPKGKTKKAPAVKTSRISLKREVQRASLSRQSEEGNYVDIIVMQSGQVIRNIEDLQMVGSSGNLLTANNFIGFENISTPFEGTVRFKATNRMGTATYDREVRFTIMEKGRWVLKIDL